MVREATLNRKTAETDIRLKLNLDGNAKHQIESGLGFLDHMLVLFSKHSGFDLELSCLGDLNVDAHHSVEDIGIVLGQSIKKALRDMKQVTRYASVMIPMDETLARVCLDISNRPYLVFNADLKHGLIGDVDAEMFEEFFRAVSIHAGLTLHMEVLYGKNNHHMVEALFKAFARAMKKAVAIDETIEGVMSSKGLL